MKEHDKDILRSRKKSQPRNYENKRFGRLTAIRKVYQGGKKGVFWECLCDCGKKTISAAGNLQSGGSRSCGCLRDKGGEGVNPSRVRLYRIWKNIKQRCFNSNNPDYYWDGRKNRTVCDEWRNSYLNFKKWALSHGYRGDLTIDRIDNDGNYCPENCQWITKSENARKSSLIYWHGEYIDR